MRTATKENCKGIYKRHNTVRNGVRCFMGILSAAALVGNAPNSNAANSTSRSEQYCYCHIHGDGGCSVPGSLGQPPRICLCSGPPPNQGVTECPTRLPAHHHAT
jgi:hypothetical protein